MRTVISRDGTTIAYDRSGGGPAVILVGGALSDRSAAAPLVSLMAAYLTTFAYDRRGRGDSGDAAPYAVEREIEDIGALIEAAGGVKRSFDDKRWVCTRSCECCKLICEAVARESIPSKCQRSPTDSVRSAVSICAIIMTQQNREALGHDVPAGKRAKTGGNAKWASKSCTSK
jgi:hypothetical protein